MVLSGAGLPVEVIRKQICSAIDLIIHLSRLRDGSRKVMEISEIIGMQQGEVALNPLFIFKEEESLKSSRVIGRLHATEHVLLDDMKLRMSGVMVEVN
jgi:pilus assembly protein CpaF